MLSSVSGVSSRLHLWKDSPLMSFSPPPGRLFARRRHRLLVLPMSWLTFPGSRQWRKQLRLLGRLTGGTRLRSHGMVHAEIYLLITRWALTTYSSGSKRSVARAPNKSGVSLDMEVPRTTNCRASDGIASTGGLGALTAASVTARCRSLHAILTL